MSQFNNLAEFYPFYLSEHQNLTCRRLHFVGSSLVLGCLAALFLTGQWYFCADMALHGLGISCSKRTSRPVSSSRFIRLYPIGSCIRIF